MVSLPNRTVLRRWGAVAWWRGTVLLRWRPILHFFYDIPLMKFLRWTLVGTSSAENSIRGKKGDDTIENH